MLITKQTIGKGDRGREKSAVGGSWRDAEGRKGL